jgi:hypothetical protein
MTSADLQFDSLWTASTFRNLGSHAKGRAMTWTPTWTPEPDEKDPTLIHQALVLQPDAPLEPALIEFWKRILSDGCANAASSGWRSLSIEICERQTEQDSQGYMHATFRDGQRKPCKGAGHYFLRSDAFTCLQGRGEDHKASSRKQSRWFLEQYTMLKAAARSPEVVPLFEKINGIRPMRVDAATGYGWFDLRAGEDSFGRLPAEDQAHLEHRDAAPGELLLDLIGGSDQMQALQELTAALVAYTPPSFEIICCDITEGVEQGQRALFYNIQCPSFPDDGTSVVNDRVHKAATRLVRQMAPTDGAFPGIALRLELQKNGMWQQSMKLMSKAAA